MERKITSRPSFAGKIGSLKKTCQNKVNWLTAKNTITIFGFFWSFLANFACKNPIYWVEKTKNFYPLIRSLALCLGENRKFRKKTLSKQGHARILTIFLTFQIDKSMWINWHANVILDNAITMAILVVEFSVRGYKIKRERIQRNFDIFWQWIMRCRQKLAYLEWINFFINWSKNIVIFLTWFFRFIPMPIICSNWHFDFLNKIPRTISFESVILFVKVFSIGASFKSFGAL